MRTLIDATDAGATRRSVQMALGNFAQSIGFEYYAYVHLADQGMVSLSNYPKEWQARYIERQYAKVDPIVTTAKRVMKMFTWSADGKWSAEQNELFRESRDFGIGSGLSIPIQTAFGSYAMLTVANDATSLKPSSPQDAPLAATALTYLHLRLLRLDDEVSSEAASPLSTQEAICLQWCALGKHMSDIAQILDIRVRTVQFHLDNARDKLGAVSLPHAVRLALHRKLIR